jgi:hypothetical protein
MKSVKTLLILTFYFGFSCFTKANMDCIWSAQRAGITISYVGSCTFENRVLPDSILKTVLAQLNGRDTSLRILVLINHRNLSYSGTYSSNYLSIAFDTLREIDNDFIFDYYWNQESISTGRNGGLNTFRSQNAPLDINATNDRKATQIVGLKIIYDIDYRLGKPAMSDLVKAIVFAAKNTEFVKREQRRDTVRYNTNGWYVSLVTIDTFAINKIIGRRRQITHHEVVREETKSTTNYWLYGFAGVILVGLVVYKLRQYTANRERGLRRGTG